MKQYIEKRLEEIEARNKRVKNYKTWDTSWTRRISIMTLTYLVVVAYLHLVVHIRHWVNALVTMI